MANQPTKVAAKAGETNVDTEKESAALLEKLLQGWSPPPRIKDLDLSVPGHVRVRER